jgi:hypothetical protein
MANRTARCNSLGGCDESGENKTKPSTANGPAKKQKMETLRGLERLEVVALREAFHDLVENGL